MASTTALFQIDKMIGQLRLLTKLPEAAAEKAAEAIEREVNRTISAGQAPDGTPWRLRKDGGKPLQNAASKVAVGAIGSTIIVRLKDRATVLHHFGYARGGVRRQVIPEEIHPRMRVAIERAILDAAKAAGLA